MFYTCFIYPFNQSKQHNNVSTSRPFTNTPSHNSYCPLPKTGPFINTPSYNSYCPLPKFTNYVCFSHDSYTHLTTVQQHNNVLTVSSLNMNTKPQLSPDNNGSLHINTKSQRLLSAANNGSLNKYTKLQQLLAAANSKSLHI